VIPYIVHRWNDLAVAEKNKLLEKARRERNESRNRRGGGEEEGLALKKPQDCEMDS